MPLALKDRPFTTATAAQHGVTPTMLTGSSYRRLFLGVHADARLVLDLGVWVQAALLILPADAVVTSLTGLHLRRVLVGPAWPLRITSQHRHPVRRAGIDVRRAGSRPPGSARVASPEHSFASACAVLDLVDAVTAGDWLVHRGHTTIVALAAYVTDYHGPGAPMARRALELVRARVESPRETYVRLLLVLVGLPGPACNIDIRVAGSFIGRADLVWTMYRVVVEYDGRQHAEDADQWERDLDRLDDFENATWGHVRITARRLRRPREVVRRVHRKLVAHGYRGPAPVFGPEWVALFETRTAAGRAREWAHPDSWAVDCALGGRARPPD